MNFLARGSLKQPARSLLVFAAAISLASSASADLLVGNFFSPALDVLRFNQSGAFVSTFVPTNSGGLSFPLGGAFGPDGNFYVSDSDHENILRYDGATGAFLNIFGSTDDPAGLAFGSNGNLYVANSANPGSVTELNGTTGAEIATLVGGLSDPEGIAFGPNGNLFVADGDNSRIVQFNGATGVSMGTFASGQGLAAPRGLTFGPDGNLYVTNFGGGSVLRFNGSTGAFIDTFVTAGSGGLSLPRPLLFGPDGNLYVGSYGSGDILRYNGTTGAFMNTFVAAGSGGLGGPTFLVFHDFATTGGTVPEPPTLVLVLTALGLGLLVGRRRRGELH